MGVMIDPSAKSLANATEALRALPLLVARLLPIRSRLDLLLAECAK